MILKLLIVGLSFAALAAQALDVDSLPSIKDLPDPFLFNDGTRVKSKEDWERRRVEIQEIVQTYEYGHLPPAPGNTTAVEIIGGPSRLYKGATHRLFKVTCGPDQKVSFLLDLTIPVGKGPFPVILRGDGCWGKLDDAITGKIIERGYILADYNRCELAPDNKNRATGLYVAYPEYKDLGAAAAWAWGFHRCVDVLLTQSYVDGTKITVTGHSRGGKGALLAGATDSRIALTVPNNSGCGGAGSFKFQGEKSEDIAAICRSFDFWFTPLFKEFAGKQEHLPLDQHFVKALVAPRALLTMEALGDLWGNPGGSRQTYAAAKEVYAFLGVPKNLATFYREGKHEQNAGDWEVLLDFADQLFFGKASSRDFDANPFPNAPKAYSWTAPK